MTFPASPNTPISASVSKTNTARVSRKRILFGSSVIFFSLLSLGIGGAAWFTSRYQVSNEMQVNLKELSNAEYPANPAPLGKNFQRYSNRELKVIKRDDTHFDFILEPNDERTARIVIKNVDLSLMVPKAPKWVKQDQGLETITFVDREWNRQQVSFSANSEHIEITGGDGFEEQKLEEIALANNCLNAGLWEVLLFTKEDGKKTLYYQGWFTFPIGHYKNVFEKINNLSYWKHWWRLEHWQDPQGTTVNLGSLREVLDERPISTQFPLNERIIVSGEQGRKVRTTLAKNLTTWKDFYTNTSEIKFATFLPPGFYDPSKPWKNQYWRIGEFNSAILRTIKPVGIKQNLQEIELEFKDTKTNEKNRLFISGINLKELPRLSVEKYSDGLYMPMGIGVPPFFESYEKLEKNHPDQSPYFNVLLDSKNKWIDHHRLAVDGVVMHLDQDSSSLLHLYLLSYERNTLVAHFLIDLGIGTPKPES